MSELEEFRERKDHFMEHHPQSPLTPAQKRKFGGLDYFPENEDLHVIADFEPYEDPEVMTMVISTGGEAEFRRIGQAQFEVNGKPQTLEVYEPADNGELFLPFTDATSGDATYGAGRYLEPHFVDEGKIELDFNYAYNPYCAYNENWACPIPRPENRLDVPIEAGEKKFEG